MSYDLSALEITAEDKELEKLNQLVDIFYLVEDKQAFIEANIEDFTALVNRNMLSLELIQQALNDKNTGMPMLLFQILPHVVEVEQSLYCQAHWDEIIAFLMNQPHETQEQFITVLNQDLFQNLVNHLDDRMMETRVIEILKTTHKACAGSHEPIFFGTLFLAFAASAFDPTFTTTTIICILGVAIALAMLVAGYVLPKVTPTQHEHLADFDTSNISEFKNFVQSRQGLVAEEVPTFKVEPTVPKNSNSFFAFKPEQYDTEVVSQNAMYPQ